MMEEVRIRKEKIHKNYVIAAVNRIKRINGESDFLRKHSVKKGVDRRHFYWSEDAVLALRMLWSTRPAGQIAVKINDLLGTNYSYLSVLRKARKLKLGSYKFGRKNGGMVCAQGRAGKGEGDQILAQAGAELC